MTESDHPFKNRPAVDDIGKRVELQFPYRDRPDLVEDDLRALLDYIERLEWHVGELELQIWGAREIEKVLASGEERPK